MCGGSPSPPAPPAAAAEPAAITSTAPTLDIATNSTATKLKKKKGIKQFKGTNVVPVNTQVSSTGLSIPRNTS